MDMAATRRERRVRAAAGTKSPLPARAAILTVALLCAATMVRTGGSAFLSRARPELALVLMPENARAALATARADLAKHAKPEDRRVQALVKTALARDATLPGAVEIAAMAAADQGDHRKEARLFALSDRISRRSLTTRLWLIQHAVEAQDADGALRNFDLALRTSSEAPVRLFPILLRASKDPVLARKIARLADRPLDWPYLLLDYAAQHGDPEGAAKLLLDMRNRATIARADAVPRLTVRLIDARQFDLARQMHAQFAPISSAVGMVVDPSFADPRIAFPFGWGLNQSGGLSVYRTVERGRTGLAYTAETGRAGQAASQALFLAAGRYRLASRMASAPARDIAPFWLIACASAKGEPLLRADAGAAPHAAIMTAFEVPSDCPVQWLSLNLRARFESGGQSGEILSVRIEPVQKN